MLGNTAAPSTLSQFWSSRKIGSLKIPGNISRDKCIFSFLCSFHTGTGTWASLQPGFIWKDIRNDTWKDAFQKPLARRRLLKGLVPERKHRSRALTWCTSEAPPLFDGPIGGTPNARNSCKGLDSCSRSSCLSPHSPSFIQKPNCPQLPSPAGHLVVAICDNVGQPSCDNMDTAILWGQPSCDDVRASRKGHLGFY
ncbi:hypothetical protein QTO34_002151 [Cnephaeus nilssonii]|uniref:Uncharacterized protein n=1 Tax=Cnephaeus nilssonii TaxID=3371016 RepID=A0AA40HV85_CNENI|nr:hypothetical protein QTO34_002151 [Eptesicus nilssonii]